VQHRRLRDSEIFFAALLALTATLVGSRLLGALVSDAAAVNFPPSLMARFGPSSTVANFSTFFVLLPVSLIFIAIGIPFALRSVAAAFRRDLERREVVGLLAVFGCLAGLVFEARAGGTGLLAFTATTALAYWQLWPPLAARGRRAADWAAAIAGGAGLTLAYYQWTFIGGGELSVFVAPTFLVVAFYACVTAVALALPSAVARPRVAPIGAALLACAGLAWLASAQLRDFAAGIEAADRLELAVSSSGAGILLLSGIVGRLRA